MKQITHWSNDKEWVESERVRMNYCCKDSVVTKTDVISGEIAIFGSGCVKPQTPPRLSYSIMNGRAA